METTQFTDTPAGSPGIGENGEPGIPGRRAALTKFASAVFAGLVAPALLGSTKASPLPDRAEFPSLPDRMPDEDESVRMMRDLLRALDKPIEERSWGMVIDLRKCVGCHGCTIACAAENNLPPGVIYRPVIEEEIGTFPNVSQRFIPRPCMQCENPPCVPACPVAATYVRPDGVIAIDYDACIGCRYCITACPYNARTFDFGESYSENQGFAGYSPQERAPNHEYGKSWNRGDHGDPVGSARKCHFCVHRVENGLLPQCVTTCLGRATYFGDMSDPDSRVAELAASPNVMRLKEHMGTRPRVYYLT
jgi:Fe-S-cluster-containing dehydrogenase component